MNSQPFFLVSPVDVEVLNSVPQCLASPLVLMERIVCCHVNNRSVLLKRLSAAIYMTFEVTGHPCRFGEFFLFMVVGEVQLCT